MRLSTAEKRRLIEPNSSFLGTDEQCSLLELPRSSYYYAPSYGDPLNLELMHQLDELYTQHPFYGSRKMMYCLNQAGYSVNRKRIQRLMRLMGLEAIYPKKNLSKNNPEHRIYPYLLRGVPITHPNHVWSTDITYVRLEGGFVYLVAVIDWFSRYVLSWELSNSLDSHFCLLSLKAALKTASPEIFNTDQGSQFTSHEFTKELIDNQIKISMDGKGRALDNIFVERLWRSVKYENIYIKGYINMIEAYQGLADYFNFYNNERPHQSLGYKTPREVYSHQPRTGTHG